jgi:hypothetical protein
MLAVLISQPTLAGSGGKKRIAILDVKTMGTFDPKAVQGLSMVVTSEAERFPLKVVAGADLSALMGFEQQKQLLGCSDSSCLAELGGALGVDYLLSVQVSEVGDVWLLSATLLDVIKANSIKRVSRKVAQVRDLVEAAQAATYEALEAVAKPDGPPPRPAQPASSATSEAGAPMTTMRKAGIGLAAGGGALLLGGGICGVLAMGKYNDAKSAPDGTTFRNAKSAGQTEALVADILYGVGGAAAITGVVLAIIGGNSGSSSAAQTTGVAIAPSPGGASLVVSGAF